MNGRLPAAEYLSSVELRILFVGFSASTITPYPARSTCLQASMDNTDDNNTATSTAVTSLVDKTVGEDLVKTRRKRKGRVQPQQQQQQQAPHDKEEASDDDKEEEPATVPATAGFDADDHAIARAHLLGKEESKDYIEISMKIDQEFEDLLWVRDELRDLDEDQFSLGRLRFYQAANNLSDENPLRASAHEAIALTDKRFEQHRTRLLTRERQNSRRIQELKAELKAMELKILTEWESVKKKK